MRIKGKITFWKADKGYGFITPDSGAKKVFVHINAFADKSNRPRINQLVSFSLSEDKQGRPCAVRVTRAGEELPDEIKRNDKLLYVLGAVFFLAAVALSVVTGSMPLPVLLVYLVASSLTYAIYAMDKSAASSGAWRTQESTLHGLSLIGGWPGALIAQQVLRHKSKKEEFRFVFWLTVVINIGIFLWLFTDTGSVMLEGLLNQ
jgi:uncharacterized membrane protein YsdA (DUF1294 family)/cold shock CspA family protein